MVRTIDITVRNNLDIHRRENRHEISPVQRLAGRNSITWKLEAACFSKTSMSTYTMHGVSNHSTVLSPEMVYIDI